MRKIYKALTIVLCFGILSGCTTMMRRADAPVGTFQPTDMRIQSSLDIDLFKLDGTLFHQISLKVYKGRVLVTGHAPNQELRQQMEQIIKETTGVKAVYNHTTIGKSREPGEYASDKWIATKIGTKLFFTGSALSDYYQLDVCNGVVYLLGEARSVPERQEVIDMAKDVPNVVKVYSYIDVAPHHQ